MVKGRFGKLKCVGGLIYTEGTTSVLEVLFHWNEGKRMRRVSKFLIHINVGVWCTAVTAELYTVHCTLYTVQLYTLN